jgi:hypothetical protein
VDRAILIRHRLLTSREIDDAQPPVAEEHTAIGIRSAVIRATMTNHIRHSGQDGTGV